MEEIELFLNNDSSLTRFDAYKYLQDQHERYTQRDREWSSFKS